MSAMKYTPANPKPTPNPALMHTNNWPHETHRMTDFLFIVMHFEYILRKTMATTTNREK